MYIDPGLLKQAQDHPDQVAELVITVRKYSEALRKALEDSGLRITGLEQAKDGIIYGNIRLADLPALKNVPRIESIEPDSMQTVLN